MTPNYGIRWTGDSWRPGGNTAWISGYSGIKFFTSRTRRLSIQDGIIEASDPFIINPTNAARNYMQFRNNGTNIGIIGSNGSIYGNNETDFGIYVYGNGNLEISTSNKKRMIVTGSGNVGIGTIAPNEKFEVNGKIRAKEIKVENNNWPDYVFESSYKLRPLSQVEYFIKSNGRLPEMPSAREVKENGLEVGANQAMLLKKIEELTLYIIEQEKQMKNYCEELAEVKTELRKLRRKG